MNIEVKGINEILVLKCREDVAFSDVFNDLHKLLDQPFFNQDGFYPRAFFDFGCRVMQDHEITDLINFLSQTKKILFEGMNTIPSYQHIHLNKEDVYNGEEICVTKPTLFLGTIHSDAYIYCYEDVYFLNQMSGHLIVMNEHAKIYGNVTIHDILKNQKLKQNTTSFALKKRYDNKQIDTCMREEYYDKDYCIDIG